MRDFGPGTVVGEKVAKDPAGCSSPPAAGMQTSGLLHLA